MKLSTLTTSPLPAKKSKLSKQEITQLLKKDTLLTPHATVISNILSYAEKKQQKAADSLQ
jgi:hypothetical protein